MRERPKDKARLEHILRACGVIEDAVKEFGLDVILAKPIMYHGLVKQIEIIGEAVYMLSKEFRERHPMVEWDAIEGMRHVLVHDYYLISEKEVRTVAEKDIVALCPVIQKLYDEEG